MNEHYPFKLMILPYEYNSLEPYIDEETMKIHHLGHLKTYVDNLNKILANYPKLHNWSLEKILYNISSIPKEIKLAVKNNAGGVYNHNLYFNSLSPKKEINLSTNFENTVKKQFGSFDNYLSELKEKSLSVFGSGYSYVVLDIEGNIMIITTKNQDTPLELNLYPLLPIDVWEHAYYLKHKNKRVEYIEDIFKVINWNIIEKRYNDFFRFNSNLL